MFAGDPYPLLASDTMAASLSPRPPSNPPAGGEI